jgi:predicted transcriptional regulator YheO
VSYLGRWIDLFARHPSGRTIAVELKVTEWRRAFNQARMAQPAASQTYIGLWAPYVHRAESAEAIQALQETGIGLLCINGDCTVRKKARRRRAEYGRWVITPKTASHKPKL